MTSKDNYIKIIFSFHSLPAKSHKSNHEKLFELKATRKYYFSCSKKSKEPNLYKEMNEKRK